MSPAPVRVKRALHRKDPQTSGTSFVGCEKGSTGRGGRQESRGAPESERNYGAAGCRGAKKPHQHPTGYLRGFTVGLCEQMNGSSLEIPISSWGGGSFPRDGWVGWMSSNPSSGHVQAPCLCLHSEIVPTRPTRNRLCLTLASPLSPHYTRRQRGGETHSGSHG